MIRGYFYRLIMRIAHKYHWHYAPPFYPDSGTKKLWCQWCGLFGFCVDVGLKGQKMKPFYEKDDQIIYHGDCLKVLKTLPDNHVSAICTDPPYALTDGKSKKGFMGNSWDNELVAFNPKIWRECLRVAKPGAMLFAFGGCRTHHRLACAIEDAGWEIRDCITYLHNGDMQQRSFLDSLSPEQFGSYMELHHPNKTMQWTYACLSEDTEILTKDGFKRCTEDIGEVRCFNLDTDDFYWEKPKDVFVYAYDDIAYNIKSEFTDQIVSRNHRCIIERYGELVLEFAENLQVEETVPILGSAEPVTGFDWLSLFDLPTIPGPASGPTSIPVPAPIPVPTPPQFNFIDARTMCAGFVEDRLKSPSTADFLIETEEAVGVTEDGVDMPRNYHHVKGQVDAQNSFGAVVRMTYLCQLHYDPENPDQWFLDRIDIK